MCELYIELILVGYLVAFNTFRRDFFHLNAGYRRPPFRARCGRNSTNITAHRQHYESITDPRSIDSLWGYAALNGLIIIDRFSEVKLSRFF